MKRRSAGAYVAVMLVLASVPLAAIAPAGARSGPPRVTTAVKHDVSPPLRSITPQLTNPASPSRAIPDPTPGSPTASSPTVTPMDPVVQSELPKPKMPSPSSTFEGIRNAGGIPPDPDGDIGPNDYVQLVNMQFEVFSKNGTALYGPANTNTLWSGFGGACQTQNNGDGIVLYDPLANRWFISQMALPSYPNPPFYQCIAVSKTGDPTGAWYRYAWNMGPYLNDYAKWGVWPDGYYMTFDEFDSLGTFMGAGVWVFDRSAMLTGAAATAQSFEETAMDSNLLPSDVDGTTAPPAGAPNYVVGFQGADHLDIWEFHTDWTTPANSTLTGPTQLTIAAFDPDLCGSLANPQDCIPQRGTAVGLDPLAWFMMNRLAYRNFGSYESIVLNFNVDVNGHDHAGIRWAELHRTSGAWSVYQEGTFAPDSDHRWTGSIAQDQDGNIALGYTVSGTNTYPSIRWAGRLATDPLGSLSQGEATMYAGSGSQTSSLHRWGDYSDMSVDPSDDCTFWYTNEYYSSTSDSRWRTRIGEFKFSSCGSGVTRYPLSVTVNGSGTVTSDPGSISCPGTCSDSFDDGTGVQLTATPTGGATFSGWTGDCSGTASPCTVPMTTSRDVTATFTGGTTPTKTTGDLLRYYDRDGRYRLYHVGSRFYYQVRVTPNVGGDSVKIKIWKLGNGRWASLLNKSFTLDSSSAIVVWAHARAFGEGRYRIRGLFSGDGNHSASKSRRSFFAITG